MQSTESFLAFPTLAIVRSLDLYIASLHAAFAILFNNSIEESHLVFGVDFLLLLFLFRLFFGLCFFLLIFAHLLVFSLCTFGLFNIDGSLLDLLLLNFRLVLLRVLVLLQFLVHLFVR